MSGLLVVARSVAVLALALLAACGGQDGRSVTFPGPPPEQATAAPAADSDFYDFTATRLGGGSQVTGSELQGKDVALWFWAPW